MEKQKDEFIKLIENGGTPVNHRNDTVRNNSCSNYLPSLDVIVKGQCENSTDSKENAVLSLFGANTDKLMGKSVGSLLFSVGVESFRPCFTSL
jgi:hypothetical protein